MSAMQQLHFSNNVGEVLDSIIAAEQPASLFVLTDDNTSRLVFPRLKASCRALRGAVQIVMRSGDTHKTLDTLTNVWDEMENNGATRHSMLINLGGGVVTDLGGFAAASFKRGMKCVNCPTTLLAAVDAAAGGKTGINYNGLKNEIGAFAPAAHVIISTAFFDTLPQSELKSGFAEMLKHGLLKSEDYFRKLLGFDLMTRDWEALLPLLEENVRVKQDIVAQDPEEHGVRRALNLGHTVGHAFESFAIERNKPVPHGYAVAWGLVVESVLWHSVKGFPADTMHALAEFVKDLYDVFYITCQHYPRLLQLMQHDKKSRNGEINCTLLSQCGEFSIDNVIEPELMTAALDIYRDMMGI